MSQSKKRFLSFLLSMFIAFSTIAPRPAHAALGLVLPLIVAAGSALSSSSASSLATAATGLAIGAGLGYLFKDSISDTLGKLGKSGSNSPTAIPAGNNAPVAKPSQWPSPNTPATSMPRGEQWHSYNNIYGSYEAAKDAYTSSMGCLNPVASPLQGGIFTCTRSSDGNTYSISSGAPGLYITYTCPGGYNYNGSSCDLYVPGKDTAQWPNDGVAQKSPDGVAGNSRDPDTSPPLPGNNPSNGTVLSESGQDASGNLVSHAVVTTSDGGRKIVEAIAPPGSTSGNTAQVTTIVTDTNGNVVSTDVQNVPIPSVTDGMTTLVNNVTVPATSSGTATFPADYAKDGTVAASNTYLEAIKNLVRPITEFFTGSPPPADSLTNVVTEQTHLHEAVVDRLTPENIGGDHGFKWSWVPEVPKSDCISYVIPASPFFKYTFNPCPVFEKIRDFFGYTMYIFTGFMLIRILTTKQS